MSHFVHGIVASAISGILVVIIHFALYDQDWTDEKWRRAVEAVKEALIVGFIEGTIVSYIFVIWGH